MSNNDNVLRKARDDYRHSEGSERLEAQGTFLKALVRQHNENEHANTLSDAELNDFFALIDSLIIRAGLERKHWNQRVVNTQFEREIKAA